ncbi:Txe/YoeB family addiction module toxin [Pedobacter paludis]|nr:Txe/YoeB family addiction module toxin [Pedobacter paludis]
MYTLEFTLQAIEDLKFLKKSEPTAFKKAQKLITELQQHPKIGTGKPELKKYNLAGCYSRRISQKHRLVYQVNDDKLIVLILTSAGHYDDK